MRAQKRCAAWLMHKILWGLCHHWPAKPCFSWKAWTAHAQTLRSSMSSSSTENPYQALLAAWDLPVLPGRAGQRVHPLDSRALLAGRASADSLATQATRAHAACRVCRVFRVSKASRAWWVRLARQAPPAQVPLVLLVCRDSRAAQVRPEILVTRACLVLSVHKAQPDHKASVALLALLVPLAPLVVHQAQQGQRVPQALVPQAEQGQQALDSQAAQGALVLRAWWDSRAQRVQALQGQLAQLELPVPQGHLDLWVLKVTKGRKAFRAFKVPLACRGLLVPRANLAALAALVPLGCWGSRATLVALDQQASLE